MATATAVIARIHEGGAEARLELDYDDASNPDNYDLIAARCVNNLPIPVFIFIQRGNGVAWVGPLEIAAETTVSIPAGGPIRRMDQVPHLELRV